MLLCPAGVLAAVQQTNGTVGSPESPVVYVEDFGQEGEPDYLPDLRTLGPGLIQLRLFEVPFLTVNRQPKGPACGSHPSPEIAPPPEIAPRKSQAPYHRAALHTGEFYLVRGSFKVQASKVELKYFVDQCDGESFQPVFQDTDSFRQDQALQELTIAANEIAFKLERSIPATLVVVEKFQFDGNNPTGDQSQVLADARAKVAEALAETPGVRVADTADYKVGALIVFRKRTSRIPPVQLLKLMTKWDTVQTEKLYIEAHGTPYPLKLVTGTQDALPKFYDEIAESVRSNLAVVLLADRRGWTELHGEMEVTALLIRGSQLLGNCPKDSRTCEDALEAIPVLNAATQKDPKSEEAFRLLGQAQMLTGKYPDAAKSLQAARNLLQQGHETGKVVPPQEEARVLNLLGDADRALNKYTDAEASYDESLKILPSQPEVYASKALALSYDGKRVKSLEALLTGLQATSSDADAAPLHASAKDLIRALHPEEFAAAEEAVTRSYAATQRVRDEFALVISRKEGQRLDVNWTPESAEQARDPLQKALDLQPSDPDVLVEVYGNLARTHLFDMDTANLDTILSQAEKLPPAQVHANNREWVARIRAQYWINRKVYDNAYASAEAARRIKPTDEGDRMAALALWLLAQEEEKTGATPQQKIVITKRYQQVANLASPLVAKRYPGADGLLLGANHELGQDAKSQKQFESLVKQDPQDDSAINSLMLVCSQYVFDFGCSFSAALKDARLHDPKATDAAEAYVNLAEAAILVDKDDQTREWLGVALQQPNAPPRDISLAHLYQLWLAMRQGQTDQFRTDFESWLAATEHFRQSKQDLNWLFGGARRKVQDSQLGQKRKEVLFEMMDALEDNNRPLPVWPDSGVL